MISNIGIGTLLLIIILGFLLFGPNKLPELGRAFGKTLREFKLGVSEAISLNEEQIEDLPSDKSDDDNHPSRKDKNE